MSRLQAAALALIILAPAGFGQVGTPGANPGGALNQHNPFESNRAEEPNSMSPAVKEQVEKGRQTERQKKLIADTDHLLALANELKADMDKSTKDTLSIQVIRKAEEIEKLAHSVKERMKG